MITLRRGLWAESPSCHNNRKTTSLRIEDATNGHCSTRPRSSLGIGLSVLSEYLVMTKIKYVEQELIKRLYLPTSLR